jgi:protein-disulfide isomerase
MVRVISYEDLQCSDCAAYQRMLDERLLPRYGESVAFEHRDFPLLKHTWARKAAVAARFFQHVKPELGMEYRREILANMKSITPEDFDAHLANFASSRGIKPTRAVAALEDNELLSLVESDYREGLTRGVTKTPTVFVDDKAYVETFTVEEISAGIDAAINAKRD